MNDSQPPSVSTTQRAYSALQHFSTAEQCAARLDGILFNQGTHFERCLPPLSPRQRAEALSLDSGFVVAGWTAAWVHGTARIRPHTIAVYDRPTTAPASGQDNVNQHLLRTNGRLLTSDVHHFGMVRVTSRVKTAFDLIRLAKTWTPTHRAACRLLLLTSPESGRTQLRERIRRLSSKHTLLLERLDSL